MNGQRVQRTLNYTLTLSILPYLFLNFTVAGFMPYSGPHDLPWADLLQGAAAVLILLAFILVCTNRPRRGEWAVVLGAFACGVCETVFLWIHRERDSIPHAGNPMWFVIVHTVFTAIFGAGVALALVLAITYKDVGDGLTGDGEIHLADDGEQLNTVARDVIGGHRTILYRWAGYLAAIQATFTAGLLLTQPPWPPIRTPTSLAGVIVGIMAAFFVVIYGAFVVMRGPWSTASQDAFYLRAKLLLVLSIVFTAGSAPFTFPRPYGYGDFPTMPEFIAWAFAVAGAVGVLAMIGIIVRFERRRGIALVDDSDEATLVD